MEKIGIVPAAGVAKRLGSPGFSKELLPVGLNKNKERTDLKAVATYLFEKFRRAGVNNVCTILRKGKWDIIEHFGDGSQYGLRIAYLTMNHPYGVPYTVDQAYPFIQSSRIYFGFLISCSNRKMHLKWPTTLLRYPTLIYCWDFIP